jgi:hypothetical protein
VINLKAEILGMGSLLFVLVDLFWMFRFFKSVTGTGVSLNIFLECLVLCLLNFGWCYYSDNMGAKEKCPEDSK